jgi:alpha-mannosidase
MRNLPFAFLLVAILVSFGNVSSNAQAISSSPIEFLNAPVLQKEGNKSYQQVIASYRSDKPGKILFTSNNYKLEAQIKKGNNRFLLQFKAVTKPKEITISAKIDNNPAVKYPLTLVPPKKWQIYFVQHSHTDIGYTRPQSEILAEHMRYIDFALDYCDQTDEMPDDAKFRWTCESAWVTREYLRSRPASQIKRLKKRIAEGRIEVTAMYGNMAEIADENIMYDFLQPLKEFKNHDIPVQMAMQNDVNGIAWCMPDYFKNSGVKYLIMGINKTRSILPFDKPTCFWWEAPSGERMLAFRADHYMTGNNFGIESKAIKPENLLWHLADLDNRGYPFDKIGIQYSGYRTDNAPPSTAASELVKNWNAKYEFPKLRIAISSEFLEYVEDNYADELPVHRNAWLDWWTDGYGSTSRETAEVRKAQNIKQVDEGVFAMVTMLGGELSANLEQKLEHISENAIFFDEHTCGAAESISKPFSINSTRQWLQKGAYAWEALKKVTLLNEDAMGRIQEYFKKAPFPLIYVINSMGWDRSETVEIFIDYEILPLEKEFKIVDLDSGQEVPIQYSHGRTEGAYWNMEVSNVPALGFKALKIEITDQEKSGGEITSNDNLEILENQYFRIVMDKKTGGIKEFYDKDLQEDLYDSQNPYLVGQPVHETLIARNKMTPTQSTVYNVKVDNGVKGKVWNSIKISADLDGFTKGEEGTPKGLRWEIRLYHNTKKVEFTYEANKEILTDPEALYVAFPFQLPNSHIVFETIGGSLTQGEQLPGSSSDWNTAQNYVSVKGDKGQIVVVSNEVPLWHFSDFNMGKFERYPTAGKTWLYSWVMNNYWFTNFRAAQEGSFNWTYQITTMKDTTNSAATKFAWGVRNPLPTRTLPEGEDEFSEPMAKTLELSGDPNAMLINSRPVFNKDGSILLHFREVDGKTGSLELTSKIANRPIKNLTEVNIIGEEIGALTKNISFKPNEVKFIEVQF